MAELARLLTFMYEEDVRKVLAMYEELFGDACSEKVLLDFLGSPTRQAVMLARAYNAKERKLQINSTSRADDELEEESDAEFIRVMAALRQNAEAQGIVYSSEQFGFSEPVSAEGDSRESGAQKDKKIETDTKKPAEENPKQTVENAPAESEEPKELRKDPAAPVQTLPPLSDEPVSENGSEEKRVEETSAVHVKDNDDFVFDFSGKKEPVIEYTEKPVETVKKVNVLLAVIYALFAVPITFVICAILLVPAFLALALAAVGIFVSFKLIASAFGGFTIFADIMVVLGAGLVTAVLGLLLLWIFVWFIGGAVAGVISGAIRLGEKLCTKEVPVR